MKTLLSIALAAATVGGAMAAGAAPAAAQDRRHDSGDWRRDHDRRGDRGWRGGHEWREHRGWRDPRGWRYHDRDWGDGWRWFRGGYVFGVGPHCYTSWRWNPYWGRNVRVTYCN